MEKNFSPKGKHFIFELDIYSCFKCSTGKCSITQQKVANHELDRKYYYGSSTASCEVHCLNIAKSLIENGFTSNALSGTKYKCGHYVLGYGQHRICVAGRLGLTLPTIITVSELNCPECIEKRHSLKYRIKRYFIKGDYIEVKL